MSVTEPVPSKDKSRQPSRMMSRLAFDDRVQLSPARRQKGGIVAIQPACEASAMFCLWLEKQALEHIASSTVQSSPAPAPPECRPLSELAQKGRDYLQAREELKRIKRLCRQGRLSMPEIRKRYRDFLVWTFAECLQPEDRDLFEHPRRWEAGYPVQVFLRKYYDKSPATMKKWAATYLAESKGAAVGQQN